MTTPMLSSLLVQIWKIFHKTIDIVDSIFVPCDDYIFLQFYAALLPINIRILMTNVTFGNTLTDREEDISNQILAHLFQLQDQQPQLTFYHQ